MIIGHGKAIGGNEEARSLPGHKVMTAGTARHAGLTAFRRGAETAEETLHWRAGRKRRSAVALVRGLLAHLDAHGNHRRLHTLDNIGKANGGRHLAGLLAHLRDRLRREIGVLRKMLADAKSGNAKPNCQTARDACHKNSAPPAQHGAARVRGGSGGRNRLAHFKHLHSCNSILAIHCRALSGREGDGWVAPIGCTMQA